MTDVVPAGTCGLGVFVQLAHQIVEQFGGGYALIDECQRFGTALQLEHPHRGKAAS